MSERGGATPDDPAASGSSASSGRSASSATATAQDPPREGASGTPRRQPGRARGALRGARRRALQGERPLALGIVVVALLSVAMVSGPLQTWLDGRGRLEFLETKLQTLEDANGRLESRAEDLRDPETVERLAREQQHMQRPGEVPYVVVPPPEPRPRFRDGPEARDERNVLERLWDGLRGLFG